MKKAGISEVMVVLAIIAALLWHHFKPSRDAEIRKELPGTWVVGWERNSCITATTASADTYVSKPTGFPDGRAVVMAGTFQMQTQT